MIRLLSQTLFVFCCVALLCGVADGATLYVPEGGYATIQAAIDRAVSGDTILVAEGTYRGPGNRDLDFRGKTLVLRSEKGPGHTIIDCEGRARGFYFHNWEKKASVVSGFTITRGYARSEGGGIYCYSSSPSIINCTITDCAAGSKGGGVYCTDSSSPVFFDCTIKDNASGQGGGLYASLSAPSLIRCTLSGNRVAGSGGGIYAFVSPVALDRCTVSANRAREAGGGVYSNASDSTMSRCTISDNRAGNQGGGIYCLSASPALTNCVISRNRAGLGAGIFNAASSAPELLHCTFNSNTASDQGGAVYSAGSSPVVINSILWGNSPDEIYVEGFASPRVTHSDIKGGYPGEGNIDADPMFLRKGDYRLQASSPCLDRGDNNAPRLPLTDKKGRARIINAMPDMGAFELTTPYTLSTTRKRLIRHPDGLSIPVVKGAVKAHLAYGRIEGRNLTFAGWAADAKNGRLVEAVVIFLNGRFFYAGKTHVNRPDVAKYLKNPDLTKTGFKFELLSSFPEDNPSPVIRVFAVSKDGKASEFRYPKGYKWRRREGEIPKDK